MASSERQCANTVLYLVCSSNKFNALIAQLVEQLICNHQARGSSPRGGTIIKRAWRRDNVPGFHPGVKGLIPLVRTRIQCRRHSAPANGSSRDDVDGFESRNDWVRLPFVQVAKSLCEFSRGSSEVERWSHKPLAGGSIPSCGTRIWGISSFGRASALHAEGERFDPVILHQTILVYAHYLMYK